MSDWFEQNIQNVNVVVKKGNIAAEKADCIVVPEFNSCASRGGVGYAMEAEGMSAGLDAYDNIVKGKKLQYGDAVITESGKSGVKMAHVATAGASETEQLGVVYKAVLNTLVSAHNQGLKNIAVPELGTGIIGSLTQEQAAQAIFNAVHVFSKEHPQSSVKEVSLVVYRGSTAPAEKVLADQSYLGFSDKKVGEKEFSMGAWLDEMAAGGESKTGADDREMTDEEKQAAGKFYKIDEERKVIIYDPSCNNHGKWDYKVEDTTKNMAEIAAKEKMPVEAKFNGTVFQVTPGMTAEEGFKAWDDAWKKAWEKYKKSPEYKASQIAAAKEKAERKAKEAADNELIKNEELDVSGFKRYFDRMVKINSKDEFGKDIIEYAVRWGKLMQAEMKKQGLDHLTPELVKDTDRRADIYGMSGASASLGRNLLIMSWKHGEELAKNYAYADYDMTEIALNRAVESDRAHEFYDHYKPSEPKNFDDALKKAGQVIATVLQDEELVSRFYEKLSAPEGINEEKMKGYIPVLRLPDGDWRSLHEACTIARKEIKAIKSNTNDGNTK